MTPSKNPVGMTNIILSEIIKTAAIASQNLEEVPNSVRPGKEMAKRQAGEKLATLKQQLASEAIPGRFVAVLASGDEDAIQNVASFIKENDGIVLDAAELYRSWAQQIRPTMNPDGLFRINQLHRLEALVGELALELGYVTVADVAYSEAFCPDVLALTNQIRKLVRSTFGDDFTLKLFRKQLIDAMISHELTEQRVPVLVVGTTEAERASLEAAKLFARTHDFNYPTDFQITPENVIASFRKPSA